MEYSELHPLFNFECPVTLVSGKKDADARRPSLVFRCNHHWAHQEGPCNGIFVADAEPAAILAEFLKKTSIPNRIVIFANIPEFPNNWEFLGREGKTAFLGDWQKLIGLSSDEIQIIPARILWDTCRTFLGFHTSPLTGLVALFYLSSKFRRTIHLEGFDFYGLYSGDVGPHNIEANRNAFHRICAFNPRIKQKASL